MEVVPTTAGHRDHDVAWSVVTMSSPEPVCIACLIQYLEDHDISTVQKQLMVSILSAVINDNEDILVYLRKNLLVIRHLMDILTDQFDDSDTPQAITVCRSLIEKTQCEEIVLYLLDKIEWQLDNLEVNQNIKISPCILLLGQLLSLSPVYTSILLQTHGELVEKIVYNINKESLQCSLVYILFHIFDSNLQEYIPPPLKELLCDQILHVLNTAQSLELQMNVLALLKKLLKSTDTCTMIQYSKYNTDGELIQGLKKLFVTKEEVLQTAGTQCLLYLINNTTQDNQPIYYILNSDITEFLYESLHTRSTTQIECIMDCLQKLTNHDLFFTRCHAVYGTESILLVLNALLSMRHNKLLVKGYSLLASFLERQPSSIPLFVNTSTLTTCIDRLERGIQQSYKPIVIQAFRTMIAFLREEYLPPNFINTTLETLLIQVSKRLSQINLEKYIKSTGSNNSQGEDEEMMILFIKIMSSSARLLDNSLSESLVAPECSQPTSTGTSITDSTQSLIPLFIQITNDTVLPLVMILYEKSKDTRIICEHCDILLTIFKLNKPDILPFTQKLISCGWLIQLLTVKSSLRCSSVPTAEIDKLSLLLVLAFKHISQESNCMMTEWFIVGLKQLELPEVVTEINLRELMKNRVDVLQSLLIVLYYSYLHNNHFWSEDLLGSFIESFLINFPDLNNLPTECMKSIVFLIAVSVKLQWISSQITTETSSLNNCNRRIVGILTSCPTENWYTHHYWLLHWIFTDTGITQSCGQKILEMWLPELEREVENKNEPEITQSSHLKILLKHPGSSAVLVNLMAVDDEMTADSATKILQWTIEQDNDVSEIVMKHSIDVLQQLYRQENGLQELQITNVLEIMTLLINDTKFHHIINSKTVQSLYHVIKMLGNKDDMDNKITSVSLQYILAILNHKTDLGHLGVSPMLTQNNEFMQKLEECLCVLSWDIRNKSIYIITWLAMSNQHIPVPSPIKIDTRYIIDLISACPTWCVIPALRLLTVSFSLPLKNSPVIFYRMNPVIVSSLYTQLEIRQLYMYIQQFMCQENQDILETCVDCLQALFSFCSTAYANLDKELITHPWNQVLIETLIEINYGHGLTDSIIDLFHLLKVGEEKISLSDDVLILFFHSILQSTLSPDQKQSLQTIVNKMKTSGIDPQLILDVTEFLME